MKKITLILLLFLFATGSAFSQCIGTTPYLTYTSNNSGALQNLSTCNFGGEYNTVNGLLAGEDYRFTSSGYLTITDLTNNVLGFGASPVTVNAISATSIRIHTHSNAACGTPSTCFTTSIQRLIPAPPNDLCANAIVLTADGVISGTTFGGTPDGAPTCITNNTAPGVWYSFTDASGAGSVMDISLCGGASFDTKISVYTGACGAFACVTGNDDSCGVQSAVNFTTDGSSTYYVLVHAYLSNAGNFDMTVTGLPMPVIGNAPVIACPSDVMADTDPGECSAIVNFANAIAIDLEDGPIATTQTGGPASGSAFPIGSTIIEFSATDSDGNTVTCEFTVTVEDTEAPVAICQDITVELDASGNATITTGDIDNGSSDNCGISTITLDISSFDCSNVGPNTVTMTVTDANGNSTDCTSTVTVEDNTAPVITCIGQPGMVNVLADFDSGLPGDWSTLINTGTCDWQNGTDMPTGPDFPTPAMFFDDDDCGLGAPPSNVSLLSAVYDLTGSTTAVMGYDVLYNNIVAGDSFTVEVFDGAAWQQVAFYDTDITAILTESIDVFAYINPNFQVRWTYDDGGGWAWHAGVDNFTLDYEVPATALDVVLDANGFASIDPADLLMNIDEACGYTVTAGGAGGGSTETLTTTFVGGNGLDGAMFDLMAINDLTIDSFDIHAPTGSTNDIEVYFKTGTWVGSQTNPAAWTLVATVTGVVSAGTGLPTPLNLALDIDVDSGDTVAFYVTSTTNGTLTYTNGTVTGALFASDANLEFYEGRGMDYPFTGGFEPRVFNGNIVYTTGGGAGDLEFDCSNLGENLIEVTVTDASGNVSTCTATVNVLDETAPVLVCQDTTIELGPDGTATVDPMALLATAPTTYNVITISSNNASGAEGFTDLTVNVTDAAAITFDWDYTTADGPLFDSFGYLLNGVYTMLSDPNGGLNQSGNAAVAVSPGDVFGFRSQSADGSFGAATTTISNFMPGFTGQFAPANWTQTLTNSDGSATFVEIPGGPLSFDACGITILAVDVTEVTCADIGTPILVTVFASDASGNIASCQATVTVVDNLGPEITCPADQTQDPGVGNLFYLVPDYFATGEATATDNCTDPVTVLTQDPVAGTPLSDGTHTITLTAEDEYGNVSTCTFELTVESILGVNSNDLNAAIAMYPNPARDQVTILNRSNMLLDNAVIFDINGKMVQKIDLRTMTGEKTIDVSALAAGVYVVQITGEKSSVVKRLIKE